MSQLVAPLGMTRWGEVPLKHQCITGTNGFKSGRLIPFIWLLVSETTVTLSLIAEDAWRPGEIRASGGWFAANVNYSVYCAGGTEGWFKYRLPGGSSLPLAPTFSIHQVFKDPGEGDEVRWDFCLTSELGFSTLSTPLPPNGRLLWLFFLQLSTF